MKREGDFNKLLENINPETLPSHSHSLRAAAFYVQGLQCFFQARYNEAKYVCRVIYWTWSNQILTAKLTLIITHSPLLIIKAINCALFLTWIFLRRRYLRETLKMANAEDLNRLTSCSLVLLGHIFLSLGNSREAMNMVTPAMQLASKIPDIHIQLWASAILKGILEIILVFLHCWLTQLARLIVLFIAWLVTKLSYP